MNADARISELPLLIRGERKQLFFEWNNTVGLYPTDVRLHKLTKAQMVLGLLAESNTLGTHLPRDPDYPVAWLTFIFDGAQPSSVLVQRR